MSWWNLAGRQDDVIGDRPADIIGGALRDAAARREKAGQGALELGEILGAIGRAIGRTPNALEAPPPAGARVVAVTEHGEIGPSPGGDDVIEPLAGAIREVEAAYRDRFERPPRLAELLGVFAFEMRPEYDGFRDLEIRGSSE